MTDGFDVLVQEVMEAIATAPFEIDVAVPFTETLIG
jgi:hypothetical protein